MKKIITLSFVCILFSAFSTHAQIFWVENFGTSSTSGAASSYTSTNGSWTETDLSSSTGTFANQWFVSCTEQGHTTGTCGDACGTSSGLSSTLHLGATFPSSDPGAAYWAGIPTISDATTDKRAESPTINCSGRTGISLSFYYIENGDGTNDDGMVYYYDGSTWTLLSNTAKTSVCSSGQGQWDHVTLSLPSSARNNPNVKIGFRWVNNTDGTGTDPSYAIDSMSLSGAVITSGAPTASFTVNDTAVCQDSCITFTSTSTGTIDSITWKIPGVTIATPHATPLTQCFSTPGSFSVHLYAYQGTAVDSTMHAVHVQNAPHPVVIHSGDTFTVSGTYLSYQWYKGGVILPGATNKKYGTTVTGTYTVIVDSAGCKGTSTGVLGLSEIAELENSFSVGQTGNDAFTMFASISLSTNLDVSVFDATGRRVLTDMWQGGSDKKQIYTGNLSNGLYIIRLGNNNTSAVLKWVKQ